MKTAAIALGLALTRLRPTLFRQLCLGPMRIVTH